MALLIRVMALLTRVMALLIRVMALLIRVMALLIRILVTNGVPMARHGLILSQDEATSLRNISRYLPDLRDTIFCPKTTANIKNTRKSKNTDFYRIFL